MGGYEYNIFVFDKMIDYIVWVEWVDIKFSEFFSQLLILFVTWLFESIYCILQLDNIFGIAIYIVWYLFYIDFFI